MARTLALVGTSAALGLALAPGAHASESSVDAYAGEALVLGKPTHHARRGSEGRVGGTTNQAGSKEHIPTGAGTGGSSTGSGPSGGSSSGAGGSATSSSGGAAGSSGDTVRASGKGSGTDGASRPSTGPAESGAVPSIYPAATGGPSLSALDVILICLGISLLAAVALLLRRVAHTAK